MSELTEATEVQSVRRAMRAVLISDVYRFTRMAATDEEATIMRVNEDLHEFRRIAAAHAGEISEERGDGLKLVFESAVEAAKAAVEMLDYARLRNRGVGPGNPQVLHRMGLHFGDVMILDDKVTGHAVTVAARLETRALPGEMCYSDEVHQQIRASTNFPRRYVGMEEMKNLPHAVKTWMTVTQSEELIPSDPEVRVRNTERELIERTIDEYKSAQRARNLRASFAALFAAVGIGAGLYEAYSAISASSRPILPKASSSAQVGLDQGKASPDDGPQDTQSMHFTSAPHQKLSEPANSDETKDVTTEPAEPASREATPESEPPRRSEEEEQKLNEQLQAALNVANSDDMKEWRFGKALDSIPKGLIVPSLSDTPDDKDLREKVSEVRTQANQLYWFYNWFSKSMRKLGTGSKSLNVRDGLEKLPDLGMEFVVGFDPNDEKPIESIVRFENLGQDDSRPLSSFSEGELEFLADKLRQKFGVRSNRDFRGWMESLSGLMNSPVANGGTPTGN